MPECFPHRGGRSKASGPTHSARMRRRGRRNRRRRRLAFRSTAGPGGHGSTASKTVCHPRSRPCAIFEGGFHSDEVTICRNIEVSTIRFEWHPVKADSNLCKHRVSFETTARVFADPKERTRDAQETR